MRGLSTWMTTLVTLIAAGCAATESSSNPAAAIFEGTRAVKSDRAPNPVRVAPRVPPGSSSAGQDTTLSQAAQPEAARRRHLPQSPARQPSQGESPRLLSTKEPSRLSSTDTPPRLLPTDDPAGQLHPAAFPETAVEEQAETPPRPAEASRTVSTAQGASASRMASDSQETPVPEEAPTSRSKPGLDQRSNNPPRLASRLLLLLEDEGQETQRSGVETEASGSGKTRTEAGSMIDAVTAGVAEIDSEPAPTPSPVTPSNTAAEPASHSQRVLADGFAWQDASTPDSRPGRHESDQAGSTAGESVAGSRRPPSPSTETAAMLPDSAAESPALVTGFPGTSPERSDSLEDASPGTAAGGSETDARGPEPAVGHSEPAAASTDSATVSTGPAAPAAPAADVKTAGPNASANRLEPVSKLSEEAAAEGLEAAAETSRRGRAGAAVIVFRGVIQSAKGGLVAQLLSRDHGIFTVRKGDEVPINEDGAEQRYVVEQITDSSVLLTGPHHTLLVK